MFLKLLKAMFSKKTVKNYNKERKLKRHVVQKSDNMTSPIELNNKNVIIPDNKTEREIEELYSEIRDLQAINREKLDKNNISKSFKNIYNSKH